MNWTSTGVQSATADSVTVTTTGAATNVTTPFPVHFDGVPFLPVDAPSAGVGNFGSALWSFTLDFSAVADTTGLIVGLGNFAHDLGYSYRLDAFDKSSAAMPLTSLTQIGSYDHEWPASPGFGLFNDNVALDVATHLFVATTVPAMTSTPTFS